jgi:CheY-like chemotaxis protein
MFCPKCGAKTNTDKQPTCSQCGFDLARYAQQLNPEPVVAPPAILPPLPDEPTPPPPPETPAAPPPVPAANPFHFAAPPEIVPQVAADPAPVPDLPSPVATVGHPLDEERLPPEPPLPKPAGGNKKILLVEDDPMIAELYQRTLIQGGYLLSIAPNGHDGREMLSQGGYSLVLLDLMLPGENGLNLLKNMKVEHRLPDVPVIILSNLDSSAVIDRGLELGAINFLIKANNSPNDVLALVKKTIG